MGRVERGLLALENGRFFERLLAPPEAFYPKIGNITTGSGSPLARPTVEGDVLLRDGAARPRDLESLVREFGPVPADCAIFLLRQVCHSLADAHASGMVHRDIKPANVYVCRMGLEYDFVKVLNFWPRQSTQPRRGGRYTPDLRPHDDGHAGVHGAGDCPGEADVDSRADVYALGWVAYHLLSGFLVFETDTPMKMLLQHAHAKPVPPSQRTELPIPRELDELVLACLEKDPNDRPQSAEELFRMAVGCQACDGWNQAAARTWWKTHIPDLTGPLTVSDLHTSHAERVVVAV